MKSIITFILLTAFAAISISAQCSDADKKALEKFDRDWGVASRNADRAALNAIYADDYRDIPTMEAKASAIDNAIATAERDKANPANASKVTYDHYMITCTPNTATITHRNKVWDPAGINGPEETYYTRSVHVLEKRNGKWQVVSNAGHGLDDYMELGYMQLDWVDAMKSRNVDWFANNLAPDYTAVSFVTGGVYDKETALSDMKTSKTRFDSAEILDMDIKINGDTAIVTGIGHGAGTGGDGVPFNMKVRFMDTFVKRDGKWMPLASHTTPLPETQQTAKN
jgi:ketosteroid isomerase-like protein